MARGAGSGSRWSLAIPLRLAGTGEPLQLTLALALALALAGCGRWSAASPGIGLLRGRVVDLQGQPVQGVELEVAQRSTRSGADGRFALAVPRQPSWLQARARGYLPALRPVLPGAGALVRLSPDDGHTLVIRAGGDVMAGRRFYTPEPGSPQRPLLWPGAGAAAHSRLLELVSPLLSQADLTLLNLETPLLADPLAERQGQRSPRFHRTKDYVFASAPGLAFALRQAGVDLLGLANNHLYDALEPGLHSTLAVLAQAGFRPGVGSFGAGATPELAWRPAVRSLKGMAISTLGCTTIHGAQHAVSYVASNEQAKGGAALCEPARLARAVQTARRRGAVIVMVHGGNEYQSDPTPPMAEMVALARRSGAVLVLNHHPHVLGGLRWDGRSLVADSLGNLLFDQTLWPTFPSLLLELQLRHGRLQRVTGYPLLLHGFRPHPAVGDLATWILAGVAARQPGPWLLESGVLEADLAGRARSRLVWNDLSGAAEATALWQVPAGSHFCGSRRITRLELGRDLIGVGRFEDELLGAMPGAGALWSLTHQDQQLDPAAAHQGRYGVRLQRRRYNRQPVLLRPLHRLPVRPGQALSLLAWLRGSSGAAARLQFSWYESRRGASQARISRAIPLRRPGHWQPLRVDLQVPAHSVALGVAIALDPPRQGQAHLDIDEVALVHWLPPAAGLRRGAEWLRTRGRGGSVCIASARLPGGGEPGSGAALTAWPQPAKRMSRLRR